jgi:PAS domain S-box-containing protein
MIYTDAGEKPELTPDHISKKMSGYAIRLYSFISKINQAISHEREEQALFEQACQISLEAGGFEFAWIGIPGNGARDINMAASAGTTDDDRAFFAGYKYDPNGPIDRIIKGADYHFVSDIRNQPNLAFNAYAKKRGFNSAICLAIRHAGTTVATLNLYSAERSFFDDAEIALLTEVTRDISFGIAHYRKERERREAEKKLEARNLKLKQAHALAKMGSFEHNTTSGEVIWSDELLQIYGLLLEIKVHTFDFWLSHVHPEDRALVLEWTKTSVTAEASRSLAHRIVRPDGEIRNISSAAQYLPDDEGNLITLVGIGQDITDMMDTTRALQASENALRNSELRYKQIIELAQEGIWVMNAKGETVFTNKKVSEILQYTAAEMYGRDMFFFVNDSDKRKAGFLIRKWLGGSNGLLEVCLRSKDGASVWVNMSSKLINGADGDQQSIITTISDITAGKQAEEKDRFKASLLNMIGQSVVATDVDGTITYWNKAAQSIYGWKRQEAIGRNVLELIPTEHTVEKAAAIMKQLSAGKTCNNEFIARRRNGEVFPTLVYNAPVYDKNKQIIGMLGVSSDITEQKELERQLEKVNRQACYGTWDVDLRRNILNWSDIVREIHEVPTDFTPDIHKAINFYNPGPGRKAITDALNVLIGTGTSFDVELGITTAAGNGRWVRATGDAEFLGGRCVKIFGSFQDITARKQTELELERLLYEKNLILSSIGDAFFVVEENWQVAYFSSQAEEFLGVASKDVVGQNLWNVFPEAINTIFDEQYQRAIDTKQPVIFEGYYPPLEVCFTVNAFPTTAGLTIFFKKKLVA